MRVKNIVNISFYNLKNNKGRSVLFLMEVAITSFLMMLILFASGSFSLNSKELFKEYYNSVDSIDLYYSNDGPDFDKEKVSYVNQLFNENKDIIDYMYYGNSINNSIFYINYDLFNSINFKLDEGEEPDLSSINSNFVYISKDYQTKRKLNIGDTFTYKYKYFGENDSNMSKDVTLKVLGVFSYEDNGYEVPSFHEDIEIIMDVMYAFDIDEKTSGFSRFGIICLTKNSDYEIYNLYKRMDNICDKINKYLGKTNSNGFDTINCEFVKKFNKINTLSTIINLVAIIITLLLLILVVNFITNTIMISSDESKSYLSMMKLLGIKCIDLKRIFKVEIGLLVIIGVTIGGFALVLFNPVSVSFTKNILENFYIEYISVTSYKMKSFSPFYIPLLFSLLCILLSIYFSDRKINRIYKEALSYLRGGE